jgi:hypothetical protein
MSPTTSILSLNQNSYIEVIQCLQAYYGRQEENRSQQNLSIIPVCR